MMLRLQYPYSKCTLKTQLLPTLHNPNFLSAHPTHGVAFSSSTKIVGPKKLRPVKALLTSSSDKPTTVTAVVTVLDTEGGIFSYLSSHFLDWFGATLSLELVAADLYAKSILISKACHKGENGDETYYEATFKIPNDFGEIGAVLIQNLHHKEMFVKNIVLHGLPTGTLHFTCNSAVQPKFDDSDKRVFFSNKSYLPSQTPSGLKDWRERELTILRGDGRGKRKASDRIYDYDVYNDLGDPDQNSDLARPVLGGSAHPYPRRCRTGRPRTKTDALCESRSSSVYVPRDEAFSKIKDKAFSSKKLHSVLHSLLPSVEAYLSDEDVGFPNFTDIDSLFNEGIELPDHPYHGALQEIIPRLVRDIIDCENSILRFENPQFVKRDKFAWLSDFEFARETLAGTNPCVIQLVTEWPLKSKLNSEVYGPPDSAITTEMVEQEIGSYCTVDEALRDKKLFVLDYHDLLMPYVHDVRELEGRTLYGSRTLFYLMPTGMLRPIAIELARPPLGGKPHWKQVFRPNVGSTDIWLWRLAKTHVLAHDSGIHQLVSHWLHTHCCMEPYIIAANRQLSAMHPIYRLLHPHFRYTMEINALARESLINASGFIEEGFAPGKYSMQLSADAYAQLWRFDLQALPADLINRGLAVEDPSAPHGLKLTIEDYPFANDGLLLWDAIKQWVTDYITHYYPESSLIQSDNELQSWWTEIRTVGHGDKKDEPWWPTLNTQDDLIGILTTIIWIASGHHAAVNFGQFDYAAYFPNRPAIARTQMPTEEPNEEETKLFLESPESFLLKCFPKQSQAIKVVAILDVLSDHSPDEEYLGDKIQPYWADDKVIKPAFERFSVKVEEIEEIIDARNADEKLLNRTGAGVVQYELLKPSSKPGVTGMGVPYSISI